jgi:hypothetical protein
MPAQSRIESAWSTAIEGVGADATSDWPEEKSDFGPWRRFGQGLAPLRTTRITIHRLHCDATSHLRLIDMAIQVIRRHCQRRRVHALSSNPRH